MDGQMDSRIDCAQFAEALHDLDRPGSGESSLREAALAHAESCGQCARLLTEAESLDFGLRALASDVLVREAPARVEAALLREFRRQRREVVARRVSWQLAVAAAAAILLFAGITVVHHYAAGGNIASLLHESHPAAHQSIGAAASDAAAHANANADDEYAGDFVALPYADDPATFEGGAVVRVILPGSALASFGVQTAGLTSDDQVPADILVSQDGTPEAIRVLAQTSSTQ